MSNWYQRRQARIEGKWYNSYGAYSVGCAVVWTVIWIVLAFQSTADHRHTVFLVFLGWVIGWTSATIARSVYPGPRRD